MTVVTRGYGAASVVAYVVTGGYFFGAASPPDPGVGIPPRLLVVIDSSTTNVLPYSTDENLFPYSTAGVNLPTTTHRN